LRSWGDEDADFLLDLESRWEVVRFLGAQPTIMNNREDALASIARRCAINDAIHGIWAITTAADGRLVGNLPLKPIPRSAGEPAGGPADVEIGWHLHPDAWGTATPPKQRRRSWTTRSAEVWRGSSRSRIRTTVPPRPSAGGSA
jgi:RimJ/RimL family protein N-acetyltransferase